MPSFEKILTTHIWFVEDIGSAFSRQVARRLGKDLRARQFRPARERDTIKWWAFAKREDARIKILGSNTDGVAYI